MAIQFIRVVSLVLLTGQLCWGQDPRDGTFGEAYDAPDATQFFDSAFSLSGAPAADSDDTAWGTTPTSDLSEPSSAAAVRQASMPPKKKKNPAATAYKGVYYDNDFSYLTAPGGHDQYLGDYFKQLSLGACWTYDLGGEYRLRQQYEDNLRGGNLTGNSDGFLLERTRAYVNLKYGNVFRFYGEMIDATSSFEKLPPRTIEENRFDALNLFADGLLLDNGDGQLWGRAGRQEMLYGAQRLISPLDWSNTRRTFDGAKFFWKSPDWALDGFWTRPVTFGQHVNNDHNFDHPDLGQQFMGLYSTYKGYKDQVLDFYYLRLAKQVAPQNMDINTFGARWNGKVDSWLIDTEGGYQFGSFDGKRQSAGFATAGLGYEWSQLKWKPVAWAYFDWASGNRDPNGSSHGTFNQLFPLGHKYLGFADLVARQNIQDVNFLFTAVPTDKVTLLTWYHIFHLDQARDALYNASGTPIRVDPTGAAGTYVGQELDFTAQYTFNARTDLLFGYSHFYAGSFVKNTNPPGVTGDVDFYYTQFSYRF